MGKNSDNLIPVEKRKKVIKLNKRAEKKNHKVTAVIFGILAALSLLYGLYITFFVAVGTLFFLVWYAIAVVCVLLALLLSKPDRYAFTPRAFRCVVKIIFAICVIFFISVEVIICTGFFEKPEENADYVVILGAQIMNNNEPGDALKRRLDVSIKYLNDNPDSIAVVTGGQGTYEPCTEAFGMKEYLVKKGIAENRIIMEDTSVNTFGNFKNAALLAPVKDKKTVIVTNNFHMFRAKMIAKSMGYTDISGACSDCFYMMLPNNMLREFVGVVKDVLVGNIKL